ncbi:MAG: carboxypeptidase-like regulatory domain-containing protein, partial [Tannerella sp.]|nr:carboxypeptidase-like regulatory domain-containing protein [Tannerella sp.]
MNFNHLFLKMCLLFVCVGTGSLLSAQITLRENNISIEDVINKIEDSSDYRFLYNKKMVDVTQKISVSVQDEDIKSVLNKVFARTDIDYSMNDKQIILNRKGAFAEAPQKKTVTGTVTDAAGEPVIGASVIEKGTSNGITTGMDGDFALNVSDDAVLQISFLGHATQEISVNGRSVLSISLVED